ncbi:hypothetical protein [Massilia sp. 9096]|uniref:hypothetical protein n=1 Tax=Massilia sp. 9096 TaxID=1500894 RepID=UPI00056CEFFF|nr:hypothetical protein [Massilia sp. 9096]
MHTKNQERLTGYIATGSKTTVSMPEVVKARYVAGFGGVKEFRIELNKAVRNAVREPGMSRSMSVRLTLDAKLRATQS